MDSTNVKEFQDMIWNYYHSHKRSFVWRETTDPYKILVSEIMLQQTQTSRVQVKYPQFITKFPDIVSLAKAPFDEVLRVWQGMGYNRRAKYLRETAQIIVEKFAGHLPSDPKLLITLPGIGPNTAGSIAAFAFNRPVVFIETNIRRVFIHYFFPQEDQVPDSKLLLLIQSTLSLTSPREWYYALMDYGVFLAQTVPNPNRRSRHYSVQSKFEGSVRQIRSAILKTLLQKFQSKQRLYQLLPFEQTKIDQVLEQLQKEGFVSMAKGVYNIKSHG